MSIEKCTCNLNMDEDTLLDSLYPINREKTVWNFCCQIHNNGCGRIVYGRSEQKAVERWNNKEQDPHFLSDLSANEIEKYLEEKEQILKNIKNF